MADGDVLTVKGLTPEPMQAPPDETDKREEVGAQEERENKPTGRKKHQVDLGSSRQNQRRHHQTKQTKEKR